MTPHSPHSPLPDAVGWPDPARRAAFERWLAALDEPALDAATLRPASADASFRRYLRVDAAAPAGAAGGAASYVVMDAPPPLEDVRPFVHVARLLAAAGLEAPRVLAADAGHGFVLLTDLGDTLYLRALDEAVAADDARRVDRLMRDAFSALVQWQARSTPPACRRATTRCCAASWRSFPSGASSASAACAGATRNSAQWNAAVRPARRQRARRSRGSPCTATTCRAT